MARPKDTPGKFRIRPVDGRYRVSGTTLDGERVRFTRATQAEAEEIARTMFSSPLPMGVKASEPMPEAPATDDWGLPLGLRVSSSTVASFAPKPQAGASPGTGPTSTPGTGPTPIPVIPSADRDKIERKKRRAESLAGMVGMGVVWGDVFVARKWCEASDQVPVKPDPKQTNEAADCIKQGITDTFGDTEVGPWTMAFLLLISIPVSMKLQSRKMTEEEIKLRDLKREEAARKLRSVP